jgi:putative serine protease PepD
MLRTRTAIIVAVAALAVGAGAGAGVYGAAAGGGGTTIAQPTAHAATATASTKTLSVGDVYKSARDGVVEITTASTSGENGVPFPYGGGPGESQAQGSGFVYDDSGHVVTNYHVVDGASSVRVTFADGSKYTANVVGSDPSTDLAVLKVDAPAAEFHPLRLGDSNALSVGDGVVAIGSPFGLEETVTSGIVSALNRTISSQSSYSIAGVIQTDAAINHGNSGGPLLNLSGDVVGVTNQIESESGGSDGVGFAIPSNTVRSVVEQLVSGQKVEHAYLGVYVQTASERSGAEITRVASGSPAAAAGLVRGDVITALDGHEIAAPDDLSSAVAAHQPGDQVRITYVRDGQAKNAEVKLGTRPS